MLILLNFVKHIIFIKSKNHYIFCNIKIGQYFELPIYHNIEKIELYFNLKFKIIEFNVKYYHIEFYNKEIINSFKPFIITHKKENSISIKPPINKEIFSYKNIFSDQKLLNLNISNTKKNGNEKRKESCKKIGAKKKIKGHKREKDFLKKYNILELNNKTEYGPTSDTSICPTHPICNILNKKIKPSNLYVSNKSGNNIQLTLGNIPELKDIDSYKLNNDKEYVRNIFNKYLKKNESIKPAGILAYKDNKNKKWIFFNMDDVVNIIVNNCIWRKLKSGRIKGDFKDNSKKGYSQYITYEYRPTHKSYFLGFNCGKGFKFITYLQNSNFGIKYYEDHY